MSNPAQGKVSGQPESPRTAREMLLLARTFLARKGLGDSRREADLLVASALGLDRLGLYMRLDQPLLGAEVDRARDLLVRRGRREPTAYIVGCREFFGRDFLVGPGVLVPRPETELIIDRAREVFQAEDAASGSSQGVTRRVLDVGTGSGCLAVTLALELDGSVEVHAIDICKDALGWARKNAAALGAGVTFHEGDGLEVAKAIAADGGRFDLVVSNPPYVEPRERVDLSPEVRDHEPPLALYAPPGDPDFWIRSLADLRPSVLAPGGTMLIELGHLQGSRAKALAGELGVVHDDLSEIPRVLELR